MKKNTIKQKSFDFALRIVKLNEYLKEHKKEYVMSKQLLRCGASIGANIREAEYGESKADFIHKMSISLKEANETEYWLELLYHSNYISEKAFQSIIKDCRELLKMLISIIKKSKKNRERGNS